MSNLVSAKDFFSGEKVQAKFQEILGQKAKGFITSVLQVVNSNGYLQKADPKSVYTAAMIAATLDLNINNALGYAYIVPYGQQAQFQIGYKGLIQLAQRTGEYKSINAVPIDEGHLISWNPLTEELETDFTKPATGKIVGYAARFELLNGFSKTVYWTTEQVQAHGKKYSKTYSGKNSPWNTNFESMALKTVLKAALSKYGIMSVEMNRATVADQSVVKDYDPETETIDVEYVDNDAQKAIDTPQKQKLDDLQGAYSSIEMGMLTVDELAEQYELTDEQLKAVREYENNLKGAKK